MPPPKTWEEFLSAPVLLVSKNTTDLPFIRTSQRLRDAGFTNIIHHPMPSVNDNKWPEVFGDKEVLFNIKDTDFMDTLNCPSKQEYALAHFTAYKYILTQNYQYAFIVEDDIIFHKDWAQLAPKYFECTPPDYALCYIGHHCGNGVDAHILRVPVFSTQSILVTNEAAQFLIDKLLYHPQGVFTIDCMINEHMLQAIVNQEENTDNISPDFCNWYAWNAEMFPDTTANKVPDFKEKDTGLIFKENQITAPFQ